MANIPTNDFILLDPADQSKQIMFDCSGLATAQISTLVIPDPGAGVSYAGTLALTNIANTFATGQIINNSLGGDGVLYIARGGVNRIELAAGSSSGRLYFLTGGSVIFFDAASSNSVNLTGPTAPTANNICTLPDATTELAGWSAPGIIDAAWEFDCVSAVPRFTTDNSGGAGTSAAFEVQDNFSGLKARFFANTGWGGDVNITLPGLTGTLVAATSATATRIPFWASGALSTAAGLAFASGTSTLTATNLVITTALTTVGGTAPVANGTYTVGARLTPGGVDGTITTKSGIITAVTQAT